MLEPEQVLAALGRWLRSAQPFVSLAVNQYRPDAWWMTIDGSGDVSPEDAQVLNRWLDAE